MAGPGRLIANCGFKSTRNVNDCSSKVHTRTEKEQRDSVTVWTDCLAIDDDAQSGDSVRISRRIAVTEGHAELSIQFELPTGFELHPVFRNFEILILAVGLVGSVFKVNGR